MKNTVFILFIATIVLSSCELKQETPTREAMQGTWVVEEAYTSSGDTINGINVPITAFHLSSDNSVVSSAGPMWMHIVYGDNKYTDIAGSIDQVFNYAGLDFTGGEYFVGADVQERFTIEMKLEGLPGQKALTDLLSLVGVNTSHYHTVIYHKFMDVKISFDEDYSLMVWEFDENTVAAYNTKDKYGNYVLWGGWPIENFTKSTFYLRKQSRDINDVVQDAS